MVDMGIVDGETEYGKNFPIQPMDVFTGERLYKAFGRSETEISALIIVELCKKNNGWIPFTKKEIDAFAHEDFWFNGLAEERNGVILGEDGRFRVTDLFIYSCKASADRNERQKNKESDC